MKEKIYVSKPAVPPLENFLPYLEKIWDSRVLSNGGCFHEQLEEALCSYLGVEYISLFSSGTTALIAAISTLELEGEVITTPFSFVATSSAIRFNNLEPVFVDIDKDTLNISPEAIEKAITERTSAILPVHCYGNPCDVKAIEDIAEKYNLKVIYDAAHAFGVKDNFGSILRYGDASILSFHATKVFNTFEGGAVISKSFEQKQKIDRFKNFGFIDPLNIEMIGLNGKMSEINSAFGILQLDYIDKYIEQRKVVFEHYVQGLAAVAGIYVIPNQAGIDWNYSYCPVLVEEVFSVDCETLMKALEEEGIYCRRYFYPLISDFEIYGSDMSKHYSLKNAEEQSAKVLCLPIFPELGLDDVNRIVQIIRSVS
jgi:dTDP-4-amino-4,6-dideoxygalactose transaminase